MLPFSIECHNNNKGIRSHDGAWHASNTTTTTTLMVLEILVHLRTGSTHCLHRNKYKFCDISPHPQSVCEKRASAARMQKIQLPSSLPIMHIYANHTIIITISKPKLAISALSSLCLPHHANLTITSCWIWV